ncbi:MAG: sugar phosphate nucleotidyltransferase [bacterium]
MKAVIPVAGEGTRLRPHTHTTPKPLLRVAGKPILGHILDDVTSLGIKQVVLIVGYRASEIVDYVKSNYSLELDVVEQKERLGLGHAIYLAKPYVGSEPMLIILGDTIFKGDFRKILTMEGNVIGVKEVDRPSRFGIVEVDGERIVNLVEKPDRPRSNLAVVGIYHIKDSKVLFSSLEEIIRQDRRTRGEFQLTDALNDMIVKGIELRVFGIEGWFDCGKPETLLSANRALLELDGGQTEVPGNIIFNPVYIAEGASVQDSIIGPYVSIAERSVVRRSIIKNSIIGESATVEDVLLDASLVGDNAVVKGTFKHLNVGDSSEINFT